MFKSIPQIVFIFIILSPSISMSQHESLYHITEFEKMELTEAGASHFARLALACVHKEYPNKLNQVLSGEEMLKSPQVLHPAFYGCFDWHSSVHGHWMLVKILKMFPQLPERAEIVKALESNLTKANINAEVEYFAQSSKSWERMYGWAWLLQLQNELSSWNDAQAKKWANNLQPLSNVIEERYRTFLPTQQYPVRTGVHPNTAFGLSFAWDYAKSIGDTDFMDLIRTRAIDYYSYDKNVPASWEPSGEDFLSPALETAALMSRVLDYRAFNKWWKKYMKDKELEHILSPADVSDRSDPKIVHLDGLNLSRAWNFYLLFPKIDCAKTSKKMRAAANEHLKRTIPNVASTHYEGSHWLASFAVYALSRQVQQADNK